MSKDEMIQEMEKLGYRIIVIQVKENEQGVIFIGKYSAEPYRLLRCYSDEYSVDGIKRDVIYELMSWAGYHIVKKVELK